MTRSPLYREPLVAGVLISLGWHFFWFFSVTITVSPTSLPSKSWPKAVALGPVLDDVLFRTLVETRPRLSETFYRRMEDFSEAAPAEPEVQPIEKIASGEVVSVPFGRRILSSLRGLIGGSKFAPGYDFLSRFRTGYPEEVVALEGEIKNREVLSRPRAPTFPSGLGSALASAEVEISFRVDAAGSVAAAWVTVSSGNKDMDSLWMRYLRRWQFAPEGPGRASSRQAGKVKFRFPQSGD